jgi:Rrf2 family iron-sulfur cluster assembly transcriptional regulator
VRLSKESRYGIEALVALAGHPADELVEARDLAAEAGLPLAFLQKILRRLTVGGIVSATRGRGTRLARPAERITLGEILHVLEGTEVIWDSCIFWREECDAENPCPLHFRWTKVKPAVQAAMDSLTLAEIAAQGLPPELDGDRVASRRG